MFYRYKMQPDPNRVYIFDGVEGNRYIGRWLVGTSYEGMYIIGCIDKEGNEHSCSPFIYSMKEAPIKFFAPYDEPDRVKRYIPKKLLDEAFFGHNSIYDFRETPEMAFYLGKEEALNG